MKRIIIAFLIAALAISTFAACGKNDSETLPAPETTTRKPGLAPEHHGEAVKPGVDFAAISSGVKEFKNDDGKVVYTVEYDVPWLDDNYSKEAQTQFNNYIQTEFLDPAFAYAENNVKNVRDTETDPRTIKISHRGVYQIDNILSVYISTAYSASNSIDVCRTFNLNNGFVLHAEEFFTGDVEETKKALFDCLLEQALSLVPEDSNMTEKERKNLVLEKLTSGFDSASFYLTDSEIGFVYNLSAFREGVGLGAGTQEFSLDLNTYSYLGISNDPGIIKTK